MTDGKGIETEKNRLETQLAEKRKEMEDFLYITTHDLRTPLMCVQGYAENLRNDFIRLNALLKAADLPKGIKKEALELIGSGIPESLDSVEEGAREIGRMVSALLKVFRIGQTEMRPGTLDAGAVLNKALAGVAYQLKEAGAGVEAKALPRCKADPVALGRIFTNLLDNALKYRDRSRKLKISVRGRKTGNGTVLYSIADNGIGIREEELPKIWQIFYSGCPPGVKKGEGIGLSIVRRVAERNSGRIWAESEHGKGSTFFIELPAAE